jgi:hypothetical protein
LFLAPVLAVITLQTLSDPLHASIGLAVVVLGLPVSAWALARRGPAVPVAELPSTAGEPPAAAPLGTES